MEIEIISIVIICLLLIAMGHLWMYQLRIRKYNLIPIFAMRNPTAKDNKYFNLQSWVNLETKSIFVLLDNDQGIWEELDNKLMKPFR